MTVGCVVVAFTGQVDWYICLVACLWLLVLGLGALRVGFVGVFAFADGLEDASGVPFCEFNLLKRL